MSRGKGQVLTAFLPGKTFDFQGGAGISRVKNIRGVPKERELNLPVLLRRVEEDVRAWHEEYRPLFRDSVLKSPSRFVLLDPISVEAEMFPLVFWCQNKRCSRVFDRSYIGSAPKSATCPACKIGMLTQLRFVQIHQCGALKPLTPPPCDGCHRKDKMALDTRKSERIANFQWICHGCRSGSPKTVFQNFCSECNWSSSSNSNGRDPRRVRIVPHRTGSAFYAHNTTLLNIPTSEMKQFFEVEEWTELAAAKFLDIPEARGRTLTEFVEESARIAAKGDEGLSIEDFENLVDQFGGEVSKPEALEQAKRLLNDRKVEKKESSASGIAEALRRRTGVPQHSWESAGREMLEAVMPGENGDPRSLYSEEKDDPGFAKAAGTARQMGMVAFNLVEDFPIVNATYGFSRVEYRPNECRLVPFPIHSEYGDGKYPIFVDQVQADALMFRLDPNRVLRWLRANGENPQLPVGEEEYAEPAFFVELFHEAQLRYTLKGDQKSRRMVFGLLHTMTHLCVKQASLLCGLDRNSISEYLLPRALTSAIYSNHRSGAAIGALTALYEQSLAEWLDAILDARRCVYDPVCKHQEGSCHACTHLAEMSCSFFNLNLGRAFLFGGHDPELGDIACGFFDPSLDNDDDG
jgi:hypothetical protein